MNKCYLMTNKGEKNEIYWITDNVLIAWSPTAGTAVGKPNANEVSIQVQTSIPTCHQQKGHLREYLAWCC